MNQEEKLNKLKDILLREQRAESSLIQKKIKEIDDLINIKKNLIVKVNPIIDDKISKFIEDMPATVGPTITESIKNEIKNSQETVVDALYPIIGRMIKKYIQAEFVRLRETIDKEVSKRFSIRKLIRRLKSLFTGVNERDLVINDLQKLEIEQFFIIEKKSGLLVGSFSKNEDTSIDKEMISGMLTAIKSFVEEAFQRGEQALELIEYDMYKIHILNFHLYYFATVVSGVLDSVTRNNLENNLYNLKINLVKDHTNLDLKKLNQKLNRIFKNEFV